MTDWLTERLSDRPSDLPTDSTTVRSASDVRTDVKEALVQMTPGLRALNICVLIADITDEFILGLDTLRAYDASVDVGRHVSRLEAEDLLVTEAHTTSVFSVVAAYRESQEKPLVMWLVRWHRSSEEIVHGGLPRMRHTLAMEGEIVGLRARTAELEAALEGKSEATTAAREEDSETQGQRGVTRRRVRVVAAAAPDRWDRAVLRKEQMTSDRAEASQSRVTNSAGLNEGDRVWLYRPTRTRGKSPKWRDVPGPAAS
jgi:hypothetical protein